MASRKSDQLLRIRRRCTFLYPGFQFRGGTIRPGWQQVIGPLRHAGWDDDDITLWLVAPNGWLDSRTPLDVLDIDPDAVERTILQEVVDE